VTVRQDFRTSDLYLAAYLKATGLTFTGVYRTGGRVYFIFDTQEDMSVRELKNKFFSREGEVPALTYADELRALKNVCHAY